MTTEPFTPHADSIQTAWVLMCQQSRISTQPPVEELEAEFDRFLARVRRDAAREALLALDALTRAEAQSETRRQQTKYWKERADLFEAKMNELDRAYISEHGQRRRAEDEQDRLKNKLARRSETMSRLLEERNNAEARIQAVRDRAGREPWSLRRRVLHRPHPSRLG